MNLRANFLSPKIKVGIALAYLALYRCTSQQIDIFAAKN